MREYFTLHRSVFPSYLTIESGRIKDTLLSVSKSIHSDNPLPEKLFVTN